MARKSKVQVEANPIQIQESEAEMAEAEMRALAAIAADGEVIEPTGSETPTDILMWIGRMHYPSIQSYVDETAARGACKRVGRIPAGLVPGASRVFLAHDEGVVGDAVIFGYYVIGGAQILVEDVGDPLPVGLPVYVKPMVISLLSEEAERGCGWRSEEGAIYVMSGPSGTAPRGTKLAGDLVVFEAPRDYGVLIDPTCKRFRSYLRVDGDTIVESTAIKTSPLGRLEGSADEATAAAVRGRDWTPEERANLAVAIQSAVGSVAFEIREYARRSGRTERSVEYQVRKHKLTVPVELTEEAS